jgi:hypothetical protein
MTLHTKILINACTWLGSALFVAAAWTAVPTESPEARAARVMNHYRMDQLVKQAHLEVALAKLETGASDAESLR